jgi:hypothetical protein
MGVNLADFIETRLLQRQAQDSHKQTMEAKIKIEEDFNRGLQN